jgi:hypothetical protein
MKRRDERGWRRDLGVDTVKIVVDELKLVKMVSYKTAGSSAERSTLDARTCNSMNEIRSGYTKKNKDITDERGRDNTSVPPQMELRKRLSRRMNSETSVRESFWLWDSRHGVNANEIATCQGVSIGRVQFGLARARRQESRWFLRDVRRPPRLVPLFPVGPYSPQSSCGHHRPIERGSLFCCMVCHASGQDHHPALQHDRRFDQRLGGKSANPVRKTVCGEKLCRETRRQRRQRLFGANSLGLIERIGPAHSEFTHL